jgi:hypothetical protein
MTNITEVGCEVWKFMELAEYRVQWWALALAALKFRDLLLSCQSVSQSVSLSDLRLFSTC